MQSLCALVQACCTADRVLLTGPIGPDGDSIGAALALQQILRARGVRVDVAGTPSYRYDWMPGADEMVPDAQIAPLYDAVVVLDGDCHRLPEPVRAAFEAASIRAEETGRNAKELCDLIETVERREAQELIYAVLLSSAAKDSVDSGEADLLEFLETNWGVEASFPELPEELADA